MHDVASGHWNCIVSARMKGEEEEERGGRGGEEGVGGGGEKKNLVEGKKKIKSRLSKRALCLIGDNKLNAQRDGARKMEICDIRHRRWRARDTQTDTERDKGEAETERKGRLRDKKTEK